MKMCYFLRTLSLVVLLSPGLCASGQVNAPQGEDISPKKQHISPSSHELVVLVDIHPHQDKVLPAELALAEEVIHRLEQPGNTFSIIVFGSQAPVLVKSHVQAGEAITAIRTVTLEQTQETNFTVHLYGALNLAFDQFTNDARPKSLLVISEGNDDFRGKTFKQTVSRAQQLRVACDVAMVADHPLRGSKSIQIYGFELRRLAGKTHGLYVEIGEEQKKVSRSVDRLSESILRRAQEQ